MDAWSRLSEAVAAMDPERVARYRVTFVPMVFHYPLEFGVVDSPNTFKTMINYSIN